MDRAYKEKFFALHFTPFQMQNENCAMKNVKLKMCRRGSFFLESRLSVLLQQRDEFIEVANIVVCLQLLVAVSNKEYACPSTRFPVHLGVPYVAGCLRFDLKGQEDFVERFRVWLGVANI